MCQYISRIDAIHSDRTKKRKNSENRKKKQEFFFFLDNNILWIFSRKYINVWNQTPDDFIHVHI